MRPASCDRLVEIARLDQVESRRAVPWSRRTGPSVVTRFAPLDAHAGRGGHGLERFAGEQLAAPLPRSSAKVMVLADDAFLLGSRQGVPSFF